MDGEGAQVSEAAFRGALGTFPTGVAIISAITDDGTRLGLTVNSFNSVSLKPPLVLFSVARRASSFAQWQTVERYAVNILGEDQSALSNRFAGSNTDRWDGVTTLTGETGVPILPNVLAALECVAHARYDGGDHEIFVGRVVAISRREPLNPHPLVFFRGRYGQISRHMGGAAPLTDPLFPHGW
jgi:flavin reductase (DIM6/NTAB) family NADH-FMN oxidoreductase RutF